MADGIDPHHLSLLRGRLRAARYRGRIRLPVTRTIPPTKGDFARRAQRSAIRFPPTDDCCIRRSAAERASWEEALDQVAAQFRAHHRRTRAGCGRPLCLRPVPDRGLLRRQQADERVHRHRQYRHEFAALHGVLGRRPYPGVRRGHRARLLRRYRCGRSRRACRQQCGVVPSGAVPASCRCQGDARHESRGRSIPGIPRPATLPTFTFRFVPVRDVALFAGLLLHLVASGVCNEAWTSELATGFAAALKAAQSCAPSLAAVAEIADVRELDLARFYRWFAATERTVTLYSQGVNQSSAGTDKVNAIINCHLATGRSGRPRYGAVLAHGPAECDGRPRGRRARQPARRAHELCRSGGCRSRATILEGASNGDPTRSQGGRSVRCSAGWQGQGAVDSRHQSGRQHAAGRRVCAQRWLHAPLSS